jgi:PAS domain S-box-containing protein
MNYDILFDKRLNQNHLQSEVQQIPATILSALSAFNEAAILLDTKFIVAFINEKANEMLKRISGYHFEPGESILNLLHNEQQVGLKNHLDRALAGTDVQYELELIRNGRPIWLECTYKPLRNEYGINGVCALFRDITFIKEAEETQQKRKEAEEKYFRSKVLFEAFMENTPLTAWIADERGIIHYLNRTFRKLYNLPQDNLPRRMEEIFPKDLVEEYMENNILALRSGHTVELVERTLKPDGTMAIYKVYKFPMAIDGEMMIGGWSIEITEETRLQEQLTHSIERYSYVNEATSDAIYDWDVASNILYRGKGFALLFGYHDPYVSLEFRFSRIHPDDVAEVKKIYLGCLEDNSIRRWKIKYRFKDAKGVYKNVVDKAFIVREEGKAIRVIGAIQDITEYNQLQEKLVLQEESKKREIVRSIIETQEKERRQLSVELHDNVNQILSSCKLMLEVAKDNKDKAPLLTERSYHSIQLAIEEIRKISHNLNPSAVEDFGLKEAVAEMIDKVNVSGKVNVVFKFKQTGKKTTIKSEDKIAVYRIIQEQLNNIIRHANANAVVVDLLVKSNEIFLTIEDDGKGFDPQKIKSGIGLKNIHHRVEYYNGKIFINTAKNKGCTLNIFLDLLAIKRNNSSCLS